MGHDFDGTSTITLTKSLEASSSLDLSLTGLDPYDWEHEITNEDGPSPVLYQPEHLRGIQRGV